MNKASVIVHIKKVGQTLRRIIGVFDFIHKYGFITLPSLF